MSDTAEAFKIQNETNNSLNTEKYLIFALMNKLYSFPSRLIGEIALFETVYPLPLMPPFVLGVVNRYSVPYALFDIGLLFFNAPSPRKKVLVVKDEIDRIAFLIDDVAGIADMHEDNILSVSGNDRTDSKASESMSSDDLSEAVCGSFSWNKKDVFILDIHKILSRVSGDAL